MRLSASGLGALVSVALLLTPAISLAGEKAQGDMVSPLPAGYSRDFCNAGHILVPPDPGFVPGTSKAKFKFTDKCKGIIVLKKMMGPPPSDGIPGTGDEIYCLLNFHDAQIPACGSFILRGEITGAPGAFKTKIKLNGPVELPGLCPPAAGATAHVTSVECYAPDPFYVSPAACGAAGGAYTPFASDATQGLCFPAASYVPNSGVPVLAVQGVLF